MKKVATKSLYMIRSQLWRRKIFAKLQGVKVAQKNTTQLAQEAIYQKRNTSL